MSDKVEYYRRVNIDYGCDVIVGPAKFAMSEEMMRKSTASISTYCHDTSTESHSSTWEEHLEFQHDLIEKFEMTAG